MNKDLSNKIIAVAMMLVILVAVSKIGVKIIDKCIDYVTPKVYATEINEEDFDKETEKVDIVETDVEVNALSDKLLSLFNSLKSKVEAYTLDTYFKNSYIELNTFFHSSMGSSVFIDDSYTVVKLENGYLSFIYEKDENISEYAENMIELQYFLDDLEIDLLYIQAPFKTSKYDDQLPASVEDYTNENADEFLEAIDGIVDYIDLREEMYDAGIDQYDFFFETDHHWTPEAAFWAFGNVSEVLNSDYGFDIDESYYDIENYNVEVYEDWFLGSQGKRVGTVATGVDDISVITPNFETNFIFEVESNNIYRTGNFIESLLNLSFLEEKDYWNLSPYHTYTGGDYDLTKITNLNNTDEKKVLLLGDSFTNAFDPFMAIACSQLDTIDLRHYDDTSLMEYIEENDYDLVVFLYNPSQYCEDTETQFIFDEIYE